jgi:hypothetical protein
MIELTQLETLKANVKAHVETEGFLTNEAFDQTLQQMRLITAIPSITSPERGGHTRRRDYFRRMVQRSLRADGLVLVRHGDAYVIKDLMVGAMLNIKRIPPAFERMALKHIALANKTWKLHMSEIAKQLPDGAGELLTQELAHYTRKHAYEIRRILWFVLVATNNIKWPKDLREVMPEEPPAFRERRPRRKR